MTFTHADNLWHCSCHITLTDSSGGNHEAFLLEPMEMDSWEWQRAVFWQRVQRLCVHTTVANTEPGSGALVGCMLGIFGCENGAIV